MSTPNIPKFPANRGPVMAGKLRLRQKQTIDAAAMIEDELRRLEDVAVEAFAVEDKRASAIARLHTLAEKNRSRRGRR